MSQGEWGSFLFFCDRSLLVGLCRIVGSLSRSVFVGLLLCHARFEVESTTRRTISVGAGASI